VLAIGSAACYASDAPGFTFWRIAMCCFSQPVDFVKSTNIFARAKKGEQQYLVYSMQLKAGSELAMILPLPTPKASPEDAIKFISLEEYEDFFSELLLGFPPPPTRSNSRSLGIDTQKSAKPLEVVQVGSFEASFVPTVKDFSRLDERFRLPADVWTALPQYADWGFAVFKLKPGAQKVHPMAFEFPRANPNRLFFPTVHIHDGKVHDRARFDHVLYCQNTGGERVPTWEETRQPAGMFMKKIKKAEGIVAEDAHVYRRTMTGMLKNDDTWI
jgi:hypothetical protein